MPVVMLFIMFFVMLGAASCEPAEPRPSPLYCVQRVNNGEVTFSAISYDRPWANHDAPVIHYYPVEGSYNSAPLTGLDLNTFRINNATDCPRVGH